jgi:hypothetical protein
LTTQWLTRILAAPKKKAEKMSLGDFLGDQCTPPVFGLEDAKY